MHIGHSGRENAGWSGYESLSKHINLVQGGENARERWSPAAAFAKTDTLYSEILALAVPGVWRAIRTDLFVVVVV